VATDISNSEGAAQPVQFYRISEAISTCVESQEKLERIVPNAIYLLVVGVPFLVGAALSGEVTWTVMLNTAFCYIGARILVWAARNAVLQPSRRIRFDRAATKLREFLHANNNLALGPYSWTHEAPGGIGISDAGEIIVANRATGYHMLRILPHQIGDVSVEREARHITHTRHSGGTTVGAFGGSIGVAQTFGGRSTSVTETIEQFFVEIRYQVRKNGEVSTIVVPCGPVRKDAEELCVAVRRLEAGAEV
jgi:hypothetical protein